jgi:spermidine/putrescine-binding protein
MGVVQSLLDQFKNGEMDRREFLKKGAKMGFSATTLGFLLSHFDPTKDLGVADAAAAERKLRIISIGVGMQDPHLKKFTEDTGIEVEPTPASLFGMMTKWISGGFRTWDIIDENASYLPVL